MFAHVIKERLVNVRLKEKTHEEFKIACDLRGASMSSLLHQFIVRTIREEKEHSPHSFNVVSANERQLAPVLAKIEQHPALNEARQQVANEFEGMPLAANSARKMPGKLDKANTEDKRRTGT